MGGVQILKVVLMTQSMPLWGEIFDPRIKIRGSKISPERGMDWVMRTTFKIWTPPISSKRLKVETSYDIHIKHLDAINTSYCVTSYQLMLALPGSCDLILKIRDRFYIT